ncbi:o-succinylbenzoate synthase [Jiulongibacter sp. NS-SX5]|uniref:o-succinylbenzoate synthase n=1 Tax=Jiulongibacter sp. NS-SX5 TaxID=3463854 RepID=UPI004058D044
MQLYFSPRMSVKASFCKHTLKFKFDAGTSRGVLRERDSYFIKLESEGSFGLGEISPLKGLSIDYDLDIQAKIQQIMEGLNYQRVQTGQLAEYLKAIPLDQYPSIKFGLETALLDLNNGGKRKVFNNSFFNNQEPIEMNGLVWMGNEAFMAEQIEKKLKDGYQTIKMKIGAIDFETEFKLLKSIRSNFSSKELTLRVDANGAFSLDEVMGKLEQLSKLDIHSIEQPIQQGQWSAMADLCSKTPVPIALDEELIGIQPHQMDELLDTIKPQFLIFKPTLLGGFSITDQWIEKCLERNIQWWMTSALESNIGLNAICQFTAGKNNNLPQGLGTGQLYHNNIPSPLTVKNGHILYDQTQNWDFSQLTFID